MIRVNTSKVFLEDSIFGNCSLGDSTIVHHFCNIYGGTVIGDGCKIGSYTEISGALIMDRVSIGAYAFIPAGVTIEDDAIIGPGVHFTHEFPPKPHGEWAPIVVKSGAMIGTGAIIMPGVTIGSGAIIGAGSVVTHDVPAGETWVGNPARKLKDGRPPEPIRRGAAISAGDGTAA